MRRQTLVAIMALGAVVTLIGSAGIFAVFSDRATTGTNTVTSGERASAADLQIASWPSAPGFLDCGAYQEDLATGLFDLSNVQPGFSSTIAGTLPTMVCLKNVGTAALLVTGSVIDLTDIETGCTGDEAVAGDATCGVTPGIQTAGELSGVLQASLKPASCLDGSPYPSAAQPFALTTPTPVDLGSLGPGDVACIAVIVSYPGGTSETLAQIAQSDQVTWRFAFDGTTV